MGLPESIQTETDKLNSFIGDTLADATGNLGKLIELFGGKRNWQAHLLPASFRGVPFEVISADTTGGHRLAVHEYADQDGADFEALGQTAKEFSLTCFLVGDDVHKKRNKLLKALDISGPGGLVHPTLGKKWVVCETYSLSEIINEGRYCSFTISFKEETPNEISLKPETDLESSIENQILSDLKSIATLTADAITLAGEPARIIKAAIDKTKAEILLAKTRITKATERTIRSFTELLDTFDSGHNASTVTSNLVAIQDVLTGITDLIALQTLADNSIQTKLPIDGTAPKSEVTRIDNNNILNDFFITTYLALASNAVLEVDFFSWNDAENTRANLCPRLTDAGLHELSELVYSYITGRKDGLVNLTDYQTTNTISTLEIAQEIYTDGKRESEIRDKNQIEHPGFISNPDLKVLAL